MGGNLVCGSRYESWWDWINVENHEFLRSVEEGVLVIPLSNKGLIKLHIVIFELISLDSMSARFATNSPR